MGDWAKGESEGDGARDGGRGSDVVHDVLRGGGEVEMSNFKGHEKVAGRLREWMVEATLYLYRISDDQSGCVSGSENDA